MSSPILQGQEGKTVTDVYLDGSRPDTTVVVVVRDTRSFTDPEWVVSYPIWNGLWMQMGSPLPDPDAVAALIFTDLMES